MPTCPHGWKSSDFPPATYPPCPDDNGQPDPGGNTCQVGIPLVCRPSPGPPAPTPAPPAPTPAPPAPTPAPPAPTPAPPAPTPAPPAPTPAPPTAPAPVPAPTPAPPTAPVPPASCGWGQTDAASCTRPGDAKIAKGTPGDGKTTNTYFSGVESLGTGACGGCGAVQLKDTCDVSATTCTDASAKPCTTDSDCNPNPTDQNQCLGTCSKGGQRCRTTQDCTGGVGCVKKDFPQMALDLLDLEPDSTCPAGKCIWMATAPAEAMASPYCAAGSNCGLGLDAKDDPHTASAPCGSSFQLIFEEENGQPSRWANIVVADACPNEGNTKWCRKKGDNKLNNSYNHFDLWVGDPAYTSDQITKALGLTVIDQITSSSTRSFTPIPTPPKVIRVLQEYCCGTWGKSQGCPSICGKEFHYGDGPPNPPGPSVPPAPAGCCTPCEQHGTKIFCNKSKPNCDNCTGAWDPSPCPSGCPVPTT